jgi:hypothetical protein
MSAPDNLSFHPASEEEWNGFLQMPDLSHRSVYEGMKTFRCEAFCNTPFSSLEFSTGHFPVRFGKRMELYFEAWLKTKPHLEIVAMGTQIMDSGKTLGELDYLLLDHAREQIVHLELAVKFYLLDPAHPKQWIGPNRKDALPDKIHKLSTRQFPLWHHSATRQSLKEIELPNWPLSQQLCFKAMLFTPFDDDFTINPEINPLAVAGKWLTLLQFQDNRENEFYVPPKYQWANVPQTSHQWMPFDTTFDLIKSLLMKKQSPMVWYRTPDGQTGRIFVVWW